jgi:hypothetical protein
MNLPDRWHPKPPPGQPCDTSTGISEGRFGEPIIDMCRGIAVETCFVPKGIVAWIYLCAEHRDALVERGKVVRNPKRRA